MRYHMLMTISSQEINEFQNIVWDYFHDNERAMPWRENTDPYYVLVSELMLQQTQVDRVIPKFKAFIKAFPNIKTLAKSPLSEVLVHWSGLGYNRRAKFLHDSAKMILAQFDGKIPHTREELIQLPGVGPNTAGAILAYGFDAPVSFIETNIRTVYFYHFFPEGEKIQDEMLEPLITQTLDREHPRQWYWALMDYGTYLKRQGARNTSLSAHYKKQPKLQGSIRQIRGQIVKLLTKQDLSEAQLKEKVVLDERFPKALEGLLKEGLIMRKGNVLYLTK
jgi:A/G-specific adenine glycosylase